MCVAVLFRLCPGESLRWLPDQGYPAALYMLFWIVYSSCVPEDPQGALWLTTTWHQRDSHLSSRGGMCRPRFNMHLSPIEPNHPLRVVQDSSFSRQRMKLTYQRAVAHRTLTLEHDQPVMHHLHCWAFLAFVLFLRLGLS